MDTPRIRMGLKRDEHPSNLYRDFEWVRSNEKALLEKYGECILLIYQEQVIGQGDTYEAAVADAERNLAPDIQEVTPLMYFLHESKPFTFMYVRLPNEESEK